MKLTMTGIDCYTPLPLQIERGILWSDKLEGVSPRYPLTASFRGLVSGVGVKAALHACGSSSRNLLLNGPQALKNRCINPEWFQRIQLNGRVPFGYVAHICGLFPNHTIITQHTHYNTGLLGIQAANHAVLVDASGGRGILPEDWPLVDTKKPVGFAGGLTPENIRAQMSKIALVARPGWWVDLESGLRNEHDLFDIGRANKVFYEFYSAVSKLGIPK